MIGHGIATGPAAHFRSPNAPKAPPAQLSAGSRRMIEFSARSPDEVRRRKKRVGFIEPPRRGGLDHARASWPCRARAASPDQVMHHLRRRCPAAGTARRTNELPENDQRVARDGRWTAQPILTSCSTTVAMSQAISGPASRPVSAAQLTAVCLRGSSAAYWRVISGRLSAARNIHRGRQAMIDDLQPIFDRAQSVPGIGPSTVPLLQQHSGDRERANAPEHVLVGTAIPRAVDPGVERLTAPPAAAVPPSAPPRGARS